MSVGSHLVEMAWHEPLLDVLHSVPGICPEDANHIARGVALFCAEAGFVVLKRADLLLLAAKGLSGLGRHTDAENILMHDQDYGPFVRCWLGGFEQIDSFASLFPFFSRGVVAPGRWSGLQNQTMWILDLNRLMVAEEELHEMLVYRSMQLLLERLVVLWDADCGRGVLGIRGHNSEVMQQLFEVPKSKDMAAVVAYVEDVLERARDSRDWITRPDVMML
ncbi:MAG: hypothetical protein CMF27_02540 [Kiritimatiellaceae bacterium]|jgi:hypothetical protein|nr:hypothetical protein [Kiritimatiellaceae bacterium]